MTKKEINEYLAEHMFGLIPQKDFGEWPAHDWTRTSDDVPTFFRAKTTEEREQLQQEYIEKNEITRDTAEIDDWAYTNNYCNGPRCRRCGHTFCMHCEPNYDEKLHEGPCIIKAPDYITHYTQILEKLIRDGNDPVITISTQFGYDATYTSPIKNITTQSHETLGLAICNLAIEVLKHD